MTANITGNPIQEAAQDYTRRGWVILPVRDKVPVLAGWTQFSPAVPDFIEAHFQKNNIGILCGPHSGHLMVVDIDRPDYIDRFEQELAALAATRRVLTPNGSHWYYLINDPLLRQADIGHNLPGISMRYRGMYVVAPPAPGYRLVEDIEPIGLSAQMYSAIYEWAQRVTGRQPVMQPAVVAPARPVNRLPAEDRRYLVALFWSEAVKFQSRNEGLFRAALHARNNGITPEELWEVVNLDFLQAKPYREGRQREDVLTRRTEGSRTVRSAYSRPAASTDSRSRPAALWDSLREHLARSRLMPVWRLLDHLYALYPVNSIFTREAAIAAVRGSVGRDAVIAALESGVFLKKASPLYPTPKATRLPSVSHSEPVMTCFAVGVKNQEKPSEKSRESMESATGAGGRPGFAYILPPVERVARFFGLNRTHKYATPMMDHKSSKEARLALYKSKIERKPGAYANTAIKKWLGLSLNTIKNYEKELKITRQPQFDECPVGLWNLDAIEAWGDVPVMGLFLQDDNGRRYPAIKTLARRLLTYGRRLTLKRQLPNYISFRQSPPKQRALVESKPDADNNKGSFGKNIPNFEKTALEIPSRPKSDAKNLTGSRPPAPVPEKQHQLDGFRQRWSEFAPRWTGDTASRLTLIHEAVREWTGRRIWVEERRDFRPHWLEQASPRAVLRWLMAMPRTPLSKHVAPPASVEHPEDTAHIVEIQRLTADRESGKRMMSRRTVQALFAEFGAAKVEKTARHIDTRHDVPNPAGLLITMLRSDAKAWQFNERMKLWRKNP